MHDSDHVIEKSPIPPEMYISIPELSPDHVLDVTTTIRYQMLKQYLVDGQLPRDVKEAAIVIKLLDGLDKQDLTKKRLNIEEKGAIANTEIARAGLELVKQLSQGNNSNPYEHPTTGSYASPPKIDLNEVKDITITEGEKSMHPRDFTKGTIDPIE